MAEISGTGPFLVGQVFLDAQQVSEQVKVPVRTLAHWRLKGTGPGYLRIGRHIRYPAMEVEAWLKACREGGHPAAGDAA